MNTRPDAFTREHRMSPALGKLYLLRAAFSVLWVASVTNVSLRATSTTVSVLVALILAAYPAADLVASITDLRSDPTGPATSIQRANTAVDAAAVGLIALASSLSLTATMNMFAGWAIVSGAIQLIVAAHRLRHLRGQWLMIISGAGSIVAGTTFLDWTGSQWTALHTLAQYSIGGAIWYPLTAIWLLIPTPTAWLAIADLPMQETAGAVDQAPARVCPVPRSSDGRPRRLLGCPARALLLAHSIRARGVFATKAIARPAGGG